MRKTKIKRSTWHYRFIKRFISVDDDDLSNTCFYFWNFVRAVLSVGFFILIGVVAASAVAFLLIGNIYGAYLLFMGLALPEFVKAAFASLLMIVTLAVILALPYIISKLSKKAARSADTLAQSDSSAGQIYKSIKNKTCAYIEFE